MRRPEVAAAASTAGGAVPIGGAGVRKATDALAPCTASPRSGARGSPRLDDDPAPALADLGLIGNLHTATLVSRFGAIEWACFPRFASPSAFGRLLDRGRGGFHRISPVEPARSTQRYRPSSATLETTFELGDQRSVVVVDCACRS